jgi:hypothetical protein
LLFWGSKTAASVHPTRPFADIAPAGRWRTALYEPKLDRFQ